MKISVPIISAAKEIVLSPFINRAVILFALLFSAGCGDNFEWLPEAGTATTSSTTSATTDPVVPVANAGAARTVAVGAPVTLDGSGSTAANGATLTYSWTLSTRPNGSSAALSSATEAKPTFTPDVAGDYIFSLVVSAGTASSTAATVKVTARANAAPVANAGADQNVVVNTLVTLDGSGSSDADGDTLFYGWAMSSKPDGSNVSFSGVTIVKPTFTPDVEGVYVFSLVVRDTFTSSAADTVKVTAAANATPVANAGADQNVATGAEVTLDGSGSSDANGDTLTYLWAITGKPENSTAVLSSATAIKPTFTADIVGTYVFSLIVTDGKVNSAAATVSITAANTGSVSVTW